MASPSTFTALAYGRRLRCCVEPAWMPIAKVFAMFRRIPVRAQNRATMSTACCSSASAAAKSVASSASDSDETSGTRADTARSTIDSKALMRITESGHPCKIPLVTSNSEPTPSGSLNRRFMPRYMARRGRRMRASRPISSASRRTIPCGTRSKHFAKSSATMYSDFDSSSSVSSISVVSSMRTSSVRCPLRKPCCDGRIQPSCHSMTSCKRLQAHNR
ncbi:hypothetical protein DIPPA_09202 [Diplonema papillatum]|nr:hypothetical protein DIPPA_09202 [Diplonema papillatum]